MRRTHLRLACSIRLAYDAAVPVWVETHENVDVVAGKFSVELGLLQSLNELQQPVYLCSERTVEDGAELTPRLKVGVALQAQWAAHALDVTDEDIHPKSVSIGDRLVIDDMGQWVETQPVCAGAKQTVKILMSGLTTMMMVSPLDRNLRGSRSIRPE